MSKSKCSIIHNEQCLLLVYKKEMFNLNKLAPKNYVIIINYIKKNIVENICVEIVGFAFLFE